MRAKPDMKPWVSTDESKMSSFRSGTNSERLVCSFAFVGKVPPLRGSKNVYQCLTQGLRPGLCRSIALTGLIYVFPINILYHFDALALRTLCQLPDLTNDAIWLSLS